MKIECNVTDNPNIMAWIRSKGIKHLVEGDKMLVFCDKITIALFLIEDPKMDALLKIEIERAFQLNSSKYSWLYHWLYMIHYIFS